MDGGSNHLICSLEIDGTELVLDSLDELGLIVADEIAEIRIGTVQGVEHDCENQRSCDGNWKGKSAIWGQEPISDVQSWQGTLTHSVQ